MLKLISILIVFLATGLNLFAQTNIYPKGAYMNLNEINEKKPSNDLNLIIKKRTISDIKMFGGNDYKLDSPDESIPTKILRKEILAFSSGDTLYINCLPYKIQPWYSKIESDGKYLVFKGGHSVFVKLQNEQLKAAKQYNQFGAFGGSIGGAKNALLRFLYAIDKETNELIYITPESLTTLLNIKNPDLAKKFNNEENKNDVDLLFSYLKELNKN